MKKTVKGWASNTYSKGWTKQDVSIFLYKKRPDHAPHWSKVTITYELPLTSKK
jgi:hypothetical protein